MDAYAARWGKLADRIWREEYGEGRIEREVEPICPPDWHRLGNAVSANRERGLAGT
jgi:hypothetical protein